jgi:AcrR family transcriptional regulator
VSGERAVRADARANRARIVAAARALYAEEGVDVSFNAIAHRAGIGNATLYRHFCGQDQLRDAVYRARIRETNELLASLSAELDDPVAELRRYLAWTFETADLSLIGLLPERSALSSEARAEALGLRERLDELIHRAQEAGALRQGIGRGDLLVAATALVHVARHSEISPAYGEAFLETVLRGLGLAE